MIIKVKDDKLSILAALAKKTFQETFAHDNSKEQLEQFFNQTYHLSALQAEMFTKESETYFIKDNDKEVGFLKINWGRAQTEQKLEQALEIQRLYVLKEYQGLGLGKKLFEFALTQAKKRHFNWVWLGVWERNTKAQAFYQHYGFEKFGEHPFFVGDKMDIDWLMRKKVQ
ncbi:GNAT family N-acetyltransferase [Streptococcus macacae]|uniref:FR47-like protein n=1 Tax=Streptococcus macacae NCTC 11558 TaxID=764298 RepID=G5JWH1_9STRE|nr:N-acetyltransferase [Streptococcus macacae]EHJ52899.1 FR47-like protein [Streptococcus macacae NCTC 11558]SUN78751.1 acetyltransferase [Streptococcus macacae NCTC 11558]